MIADTDWLGIAIRSESERPHEWWALGWVMRYRIISPRYPNTALEVILAEKAFSYFNAWTDRTDLTPEEIYDAALKGYAGDSAPWHGNDLAQAKLLAAELLAAPYYRAPFEREVTTFWSPPAMGGKDPTWAKDLERTIILPAMERWTFGAEK